METFLTRKEVAIMLKTSIRTIDRAIKSNKLKAYKIGDLIRIAEKDVNKFIKSIN